MSNIILEIPGNKFSIIEEVFLTAIQESKVNNTRKMRFVNLFTDLFNQKNKNKHIIYSDLDKNKIIEFFKDLREHYKLTEQTKKLSYVNSLIDQMKAYD